MLWVSDFVLLKICRATGLRFCRAVRFASSTTSARHRFYTRQNIQEVSSAVLMSVCCKNIFERISGVGGQFAGLYGVSISSSVSYKSSSKSLLRREVPPKDRPENTEPELSVDALTGNGHDRQSGCDMDRNYLTSTAPFNCRVIRHAGQRASSFRDLNLPFFDGNVTFISWTKDPYRKIWERRLKLGSFSLARRGRSRFGRHRLDSGWRRGLFGRRRSNRSRDRIRSSGSAGRNRPLCQAKHRRIRHRRRGHRRRLAELQPVITFRFSRRLRRTARPCGNADRRDERALFQSVKNILCIGTFRRSSICFKPFWSRL